MKRKAIRFITIGMAWAMILCCGPQLALQAMEEQDTAYMAEPEEEGEEYPEDEVRFQEQIRQAAQALEQQAAQREIVATVYGMDEYQIGRAHV